MAEKYLVTRSIACISCGRCVFVCEYGVHQKAGACMASPDSGKCVGAEYCKSKDSYCGDVCPVDAILVDDSTE